MASTGSSLSQESLDIEDYDVAQRRCRQRPLRSRVVIHKYESIETTDDKDLEEELDSFNDHKENSDNFMMYPSLASSSAATVVGGADHESPTRTANRQKDKRGRINHLHKGKTAKDKRKLREKRRSTGVVHLASTESTGDSLDEVEGKDADTLTRRNTSYNEVIDADNPQTPEEERKAFSARNVRNKSPSDLDADLEDNQDYDSTVSQSETNLTTIGQSAPRQQATGPVHFQNEAPAEVLRPSAQCNQATAPALSTRASSFPAHNRVEHPHHKHHLHRPGDGRPVTVHFREAEPSHHGNSERVRATSTETGAVYKRTCTAHDGMEARLLAKTVELEKILEKERDEKRHLQELLDERDLKIVRLESQLSSLNKELEEADEEYDKLQQENDALVRAMANVNI